MGLKCRLFGHSYGTPEVERSREEEGDEVVVTIRNVKRCERCGDEQMVNQTKEVTSVRTPEEVGLDSTEAASPEPTADPDADPAEGDSPVTPVEPEAAEADDPVDPTVGTEADAADVTAQPAEGGIDDGAAAAPDEAGSDVQPEPADDPGTDDWDEDAVVEAAEEDGTDDGWETGSDDWDDVDPDPDVDDAVILDGEAETDDVQWPEESDADPDADPEVAADAVDPAEPADDDSKTDAEIIDAGGADAESTGGWPDHDGEDEGYSAAPNADVDAQFEGNGLTPEVNGGAPDDPSEVDGITVGGADGAAAERAYVGGNADGDDSGTGQGFVSAGESTAESDVPADRIEFYCPNCEYAQVAGTSSMRAGDICPECKQGYIAEREQ